MTAGAAVHAPVAAVACAAACHASACICCGVQAVVQLHHVEMALLVALLEVGLVRHDAVVHAALLAPPSLVVVAVTAIAGAWVVAAAGAPPTVAVATAIAGAVAVVVATLVGPAAAVIAAAVVAALRCPVETGVLPRLCRCRMAVGGQVSRT